MSHTVLRAVVLGGMALPAAALTAARCAGGCDADLQIEVAPGERVLAVGDHFTPRARLWGCGGTRRLRDTIVWRAGDTTVVRVDAATGRVTAVRPGATTVAARGRTYGDLGEVRIRVQAPAEAPGAPAIAPGALRGVEVDEDAGMGQRGRMVHRTQPGSRPHGSPVNSGVR